ncbi:hypothetical protein F8M41_009571 [Gigaspora margarita]|uniref:F-box domain-containing protein n=1 Tax=Gigaspora margarita TaxID=4874 RepID=A0A8H4A318_GIGMA|nr:hypothetical protein F8M41_009571 [Gigaspora margarita]
MVNLPNECFFKIFNYFRADFKNLYSFLLVNRHWCRIIVPILWNEIANKLNNRKLINTCLLLLNAEEQILLIPFKIVLPNSPKPLFKYSNYVTSVGRLDYLDGSLDYLDDGVMNWLYNEGYKDVYSNEKDDNLAIAVKSSLIAMFLRMSKELKYLGIRGMIYIKAIKNFCKNNIISLNLFNNNFDFEETKVLIESIGQNNTLSSLCISYNNLDSWSGKALSE